jgi:hypothetical protein
MKINVVEHFSLKSQSLSDFADLHGLSLDMNERDPVLRRTLPRWRCSFRNLEIKDGSLLIGTFGDGDTQEEAIEDYCNRISGKIGVLNAFRSNRTTVNIPTLHP